MATQHQADVTQLLARLGDGHREAWDELLPLIYNELHGLAHRQRGRHQSGETLNTTALVHEAYLKLVGKDDAPWQDRTHFFRIAARAMRDVLVDYARRQRAAKRGGGQPDLPLDRAIEIAELHVDEVLAMDEALKRLETVNERQSKIVELRYFVGFTLEEIADVLGISVSTVRRTWSSARAWLYREIEDSRR